MIKSTIGRIIRRYSKFAGVPRIQAKGLRHSHASYLINEFNVSFLVLSQRMGHSSPEITLKHYAHMWSGADTAIAEIMTGNIKIKTASKTKSKRLIYKTKEKSQSLLLNVPNFVVNFVICLNGL